MDRKGLSWGLLSSCLMIAVVTLLAVLWYGVRHLSETAYSQKAADLEALLRVFALQAEYANPAAGLPEILDRQAREAGGRNLPRITVVLASGEVVGDTMAEPSGMDNHGNRPEVREAFAGRTGVSVRRSRTVGTKLMYVAIQSDLDGAPAVFRAAVPVGDIDQALGVMRFRLAMAGIVLVIMGGGAMFMIFQRVIRPLEEMSRGADRFAAGDLESRVPVPPAGELAPLAHAMNSMAARLGERLQTAVRQKNEMEAMLASMVEGVIAVDMENHVISINRAAADLLAADSAGVKGRSIFEVVQNTALLDFVSEILAEKQPREEEIALQAGGGREKILQVHGTMLRDAKAFGIGALIVLNDVTRIRQLESVRRDFVLNASHEIRTPVTSIKGFVETLLEGALDDRENVERFLGIIAKHADRLNAIVEDLLNLARIERETERGEIPLATGPLLPVLEEALEVCRPAARNKNIKLVLSCGEGPRAAMNPSLLVQAVTNLLDNAIKYSEPGSSVAITGGTESPWVFIRVSDEGCGIAPAHQPRLFERFYRVDKARSRSLGGTGLGLAIVKHIVQSHHGSVIVKSEVGKGSVFTVYLPGDGQVLSQAPAATQGG